MGALHDLLGQFANGNFLVVAHVHHLAPGLRAACEKIQRDHGVAHIAERSRLFAFAVDGERFIVNGLFDEAGHNHAVMAHLIRSDGIEQAHDHDIQAVFACIGKGKELVGQLGHGIGPAQASRRRQHNVVRFGEAFIRVETVHFRGRGDDDLWRMFSAMDGAQDALGPFMLVDITATGSSSTFFTPTTAAM